MTTTGRTHTFELVKYLHLCTALPLLAPPPPPPPPPTPPPPPRSLHSLESASSATRKFVENVKCGVCGPRTAYRHVITVCEYKARQSFRPCRTTFPLRSFVSLSTLFASSTTRRDATRRYLNSTYNHYNYTSSILEISKYRNAYLLYVSRR